MRLLVLRAYYVASFAALGVYLPFFPRWLEARGIGGVAMGAVAAMVPAIGLVAPPCFGYAADALHLRGWLLRVASAGAFTGFAVLGVASLGGASSTLGVLLFAVATFAFFRQPMVLLADVFAMERAKDAGTTYGRLRLWGSVGFLLAVIAAGRWLDSRTPAALPLAIAAALAASVVASMGLPTGTERLGATLTPLRAHVGELLASADFRLFLVASLFGQAAHSAYDLTFSLHLRDLGVSEATVGVAWALGVVAEVVLMALAGPLLARHGGRLLPLALLGGAARWALVATVRSPSLLLALQPLHSVSFGLTWLSALHYVKERAPARILATAQGVYSATLALGSVGGMIAWGAVYGARGGATTFALASALSAAGGLVALRFARAHAGVVRAPTRGQ